MTLQTAVVAMKPVASITQLRALLVDERGDRRVRRRHQRCTPLHRPTTRRTKNGRSRRWDELSPTHNLLTMAMARIEISLVVSAWVDLAQRTADQVNGSKRVWAAIMAINFVGPVPYFRRGREIAT